jgi:hypothetical protein
LRSLGVVVRRTPAPGISISGYSVYLPLGELCLLPGLASSFLVVLLFPEDVQYKTLILRAVTSAGSRDH